MVMRSNVGLLVVVMITMCCGVLAQRKAVDEALSMDPFDFQTCMKEYDILSRQVDNMKQHYRENKIHYVLGDVTVFFSSLNRFFKNCRMGREAADSMKDDFKLDKRCIVSMRVLNAKLEDINNASIGNPLKTGQQIANLQANFAEFRKNCQKSNTARSS